MRCGWGGCGCGACGGGGWRAGARRVLARAVLLLAAWAALALLLASRAPPAPPPPARALLHAAAAPSTPPPPTPPPHANIARELPSLPLDFLLRHEKAKDRYLERPECAPLPKFYDLHFHDTYWQTLHSSNGTFHLFGAYLDARAESRIGPAVRLLAVHDRIKPQLATHCQLWFEDRAAPVVVRALEYKYVWNSKWGNYRDHLWQPYLIACVLPAAARAAVPVAASLVERACDRATNLLAVTYERPPPAQQQPFAVCVKGLDFLHEDLSLRLVEWIELIRALGAAQIHMYELQVHPNISRVLSYYESRGDITVRRVSLPGGAPNLPTLQHMFLEKKTTTKRQLELVPYNDCLYRHMYKYRWIALLDIDEVIVPVRDGDWHQLLARALAADRTGKRRTSYHASNLYYLDSLQPRGAEPGVPRHLHMMSHVWRARNFTKAGQYVKAFHETGRVLALHNHFPLACLNGACSSLALGPGEARLQHYRADCVRAVGAACSGYKSEPVRDPALWRWREPVERAVTRALTELGMMPDDVIPT